MKKLRRKIIVGVFISATVVFAMTILVVGLSMTIQTARRADAITELIAKSNGMLPESNEFKKYQQSFNYSSGDESLYRLRYFTVRNNPYGEDYCDLSHIASIDNDEALGMAYTVIADGREIGYRDNFRYRISKSGDLVVFLDNTDEINSIYRLLFLLMLVALFFIVMITLVFWFLSKRIVKPFEDNARMQKQFITDASHELKTPLAIISANAEVLAYKDGENEWIKNITSQVERVSQLVNELLTLNRLEEVEEISDIEAVDLSKKTNEIAGTFEELFKSKNAVLIRDIKENVVINGNTAQLERLISVLVENASKYVNENGEAKITLKAGTRHTYLTVFNTCELSDETDYTHLFDRFYRPDSSRTSKTGGHGVGLSIARRIVTLHNGSIEAVPVNNGLAFKVKLSNRLKPGK